MANYFVLDNTFTPYSFDELIKPYQMYGQAYREQEAMLDAAREKEFSSEALSPTEDVAAYNMYNKATSGLKAVSDELATMGLSSDLRSRIRSTARDYKTTMDALNTAQERLFAEQDRRAKLGPDYVYQNDNLRIGDFLNGATPNQRGESLSTITNDIAKEFSARAKSITDDTWSKVLDNNGKVVGGYYDVTTKSGLTAAQLDTILSDDSTWQSVMSDNRLSAEEKRNLQRFRDSINSKKDAVGFNDFSPINQSRIQDAINLGAVAGLESVTHEYKKDESYDPLGWANYNLNRAKFNEALAAEEDPYVHEAGKPVSRSTRELDENGGYKLKPGYIWLNGEPVHEGSFSGNKGPGGSSSSSKSGSSSKSANERIPYIGVKHFDSDGKAHSFGSDKEWNDSKHDAGVAVVRASELADYNKEKLAIEVGMSPDDSAEAIFEEAKRRGITVSVINHNRKNQEMIVRGTKTMIAQANDESYEDGSFNEDD